MAESIPGEKGRLQAYIRKAFCLRPGKFGRDGENKYVLCIGHIAWIILSICNKCPQGGVAYMDNTKARGYSSF